MGQFSASQSTLRVKVSGLALIKMKSTGHVIALTKYARKGASSRVRFWNLIPYLEERDWHVAIWPLLTDDVLQEFYTRGRHNYFVLARHIFARVKRLLTIGSPQIIWVEKELLHGFPHVFEKLLNSKLNCTVIDYDDAVFLNYTDEWLGSFGRKQKFCHYARNAAYVTVGSSSLESQMITWGCKRIRSIPSTVPVLKYPIHQHVAREVTVIGWIGTPKTIHFLEALRGVLPVIARKVEIRLLVVGAVWECPGVDIVSLPWSEATEAAVVSMFDIGVMPLVDGPWERAKCGYKLIQYMAAGVVPVGASVGENNIIIKEGVNGYLAADSDEWLVKLEMLCRDPQLRAAVGARARATALRKYDVSCAAQAVHEVFTEVVSRQTRAK